MVKITVKRNDEPQFLHETTGDTSIDVLITNITTIYNGRLKIERICLELGELAKHGTSLPINMQGLTDEQITELKLIDEWAEKCRPSGGDAFNKDTMGRRNGIAPNEHMAGVLNKSSKEAKDMISKKKIQADICVDQKTVKDALDILRGAVMIVYPMGLPPHDPIRMELENKEQLDGTQASLEVIPVENADLWWAGKQLLRGKKLKDYIGNNEKTKIIAKLQKLGQGAPGREPVVSEQEQKEMMAYYYRKQEAAKKLAADDEDSFLNSEWADNQMLKKKFQGLTNIRY
ncbi:cilia- and flagella-associated protein 298 [Octopus sinensis]|uniref:Cilia- and flagella-associated protein 298 n=1 Tax=Octopus sinensis TaxID=2607531 RepID=A0A6P7T818_9MOLL|nr:cilia- and flagella-associated protein 298 [Octopus sinensis]